MFLLCFNYFKFLIDYDFTIWFSLSNLKTCDLFWWCIKSCHFTLVMFSWNLHHRNVAIGIIFWQNFNINYLFTNGRYFWALDPLINRFYQNLLIKMSRYLKQRFLLVVGYWNFFKKYAYRPSFDSILIPVPKCKIILRISLKDFQRFFNNLGNFVK